MDQSEYQRKFGKYKQTDDYRVRDSIAIPHPYCITPRHLTGKHMCLGAAEIKEAERDNGARCDICRQLVKDGKQDRVLFYDEHEQGLLIEVSNGKTLKEQEKELKGFLLDIKDMAEADGYVGFGFVDDNGKRCKVEA